MPRSKKAKGSQPMLPEDKQVEDTTVPVDLNDLPDNATLGNLQLSSLPFTFEPVASHQVGFHVFNRADQSAAPPFAFRSHPPHPPSSTGSSFEPSMTADSTSEVPSGPRSEESEGDLPDWADTMLEKYVSFLPLRNLTIPSKHEAARCVKCKQS